METLKKLTPAETLVIRDTSKTSFKDMLKFTLLDLILKKVLVIKNSELPTNQEETDNQVGYKNLGIGPAFDGYNPKYHELIYLYPFQKAPDLSVQFKHLVKMGWEGARNRNHYMFKHVLTSKDVNYSVKEGWFYRTFGYCKLTEEGYEQQNKINSELSKLESTLPSLIENNPEEVKALISQIHGNILLLKSFDFRLLRQLDPIFEDELMDRRDSRDIDDMAALWFLFLYDDFSTSFDGEYDSYDNSGDWTGGGCSSDGGGDGGGCSGCGGCGGCGG